MTQKNTRSKTKMKKLRESVTLKVKMIKKKHMRTKITKQSNCQSSKVFLHLPPTRYLGPNNWQDLIKTTYVEGGNGASRVTSNEFHLHVEPSEEIVSLGLKASSSGGFVHGKRQKITSIINYLNMAAAPCYLHILMEIIGKSGYDHRT